MLTDLNETLKQLLIEKGKLNKSEVEIAFDQPTSEWSSRLSKPTVNCWCFDLRENVKLRNMDMNMARNGQIASLRLLPMRFDVTYLITAWATQVEDEHQLLWRALGALAQTPVIEPREGKGAVKEQPYDIQIMVAQMNDLPGNVTDLWGVLDNQMRLGFTAKLTVALDPQREFEAPLVLESEFRIGQSLDPYEEELSVIDRTFTIRHSESDEEDD